MCVVCEGGVSCRWFVKEVGDVDSMCGMCVM